MILIVLIINSCKNKPNVNSTKILESYSKTILPKDITNLWVEEGEKEKDTVLIICQGGPKNTLSYVENGKTSLFYVYRPLT